MTWGWAWGSVLRLEDGWVLCLRSFVWAGRWKGPEFEWLLRIGPLWIIREWPR